MPFCSNGGLALGGPPRCFGARLNCQPRHPSVIGAEPEEDSGPQSTRQHIPRRWIDGADLTEQRLASQEEVSRIGHPEEDESADMVGKGKLLGRLIPGTGEINRGRRIKLQRSGDVALRIDVGDGEDTLGSVRVDTPISDWQRHSDILSLSTRLKRVWSMPSPAVACDARARLGF